MTTITQTFIPTSERLHSQHMQEIYRRAADIAAVPEWSGLISVNAPADIATLELAGYVVEPLTLTGSGWFHPRPDWRDFTIRWLAERRHRTLAGHCVDDRPIHWPDRLLSHHFTTALADAICRAAALDDQPIPLIAAKTIARQLLEHIVNQLVYLDLTDPAALLNEESHR